MLKIACIGLGGGIGAICRYLLSGFINNCFMMTFPMGTFVVNFLGAFFMGAISQWSVSSNLLSPYWLAFLTTGLLGGFTTFSTFSLETANLFQQGKGLLATTNMVGSLFCCILGIFLGKYVIKLFLS